MSRHQITVRLRHQCGPPAAQSWIGGGEVPGAGRAVLEGEAQPVGGASGHREQVRVVGLGEVDDAGVVGEVRGLELGVAVDAEAADHEPLEVPGEEVGEPERAGLGVGHGGERVAAGEHLVAVGARQALDAFVGEHRVEQAAGAAVGIGDEDPLVAVGAGLVDAAPDGGRDAAGPVVEVRGEAGDLETRDRSATRAARARARHSR